MAALRAGAALAKTIAIDDRGCASSSSGSIVMRAG
jgi:hypothetical protein